MNLCGGITSISENEFEEEFEITSRRQKPSPGLRDPNNSSLEGSKNALARLSSCARDQTRSDTVASGAPSYSAILNPVSREDMAKVWTRQRNQPFRAMKSSSILMKKLESGFNVVRKVKQYEVARTVFMRTHLLRFVFGLDVACQGYKWKLGQFVN